MGINIKTVMSRAEKGYAEKVADGERYLGYFDYAKELGYIVLSSPDTKGRIIFDGNICIHFIGAEPFVANVRYPRHNDKFQTKQLLKSIGVRVPDGETFSPNNERLIAEWYQKNSLDKIVLKPTNSNAGHGVFVGISSVDDLIKKYSKISKYPCVLEARLIHETGLKTKIADGILLKIQCVPPRT